MWYCTVEKAEDYIFASQIKMYGYQIMMIEKSWLSLHE